MSSNKVDISASKGASGASSNRSQNSSGSNGSTSSSWSLDGLITGFDKVMSFIDSSLQRVVVGSGDAVRQTVPRTFFVNHPHYAADASLDCKDEVYDVFLDIMNNARKQSKSSLPFFGAFPCDTALDLRRCDLALIDCRLSIPRQIVFLLDFLVENARTPNLFREQADPQCLRWLRSTLESDPFENPFTPNYYKSSSNNMQQKNKITLVHSAAECLIQYLNDLPVPLFGYNSFNRLVSAVKLAQDRERSIANGRDAVKGGGSMRRFHSSISETISDSPRSHLPLLSKLFLFLSEILKHENTASNGLTSSAVSLMFVPCFLRQRFDSSKNSSSIANRKHGDFTIDNTKAIPSSMTIEERDNWYLSTSASYSHVLRYLLDHEEACIKPLHGCISSLECQLVHRCERFLEFISSFAVQIDINVKNCNYSSPDSNINGDNSNKISKRSTNDAVSASELDLFELKKLNNTSKFNRNHVMFIFRLFRVLKKVTSYRKGYYLNESLIKLKFDNSPPTSPSVYSKSSSLNAFESSSVHDFNTPYNDVSLKDPPTVSTVNATTPPSKSASVLPRLDDRLPINDEVDDEFALEALLNEVMSHHRWSHAGFGERDPLAEFRCPLGLLAVQSLINFFQKYEIKGAKIGAAYVENRLNHAQSKSCANNVTSFRSLVEPEYSCSLPRVAVQICEMITKVLKLDGFISDFSSFIPSQVKISRGNQTKNYLLDEYYYFVPQAILDVCQDELPVWLLLTSEDKKVEAVFQDLFDLCIFVFEDCLTLNVKKLNSFLPSSESTFLQAFQDLQTIFTNILIKSNYNLKTLWDSWYELKLQNFEDLLTSSNNIKYGNKSPPSNNENSKFSDSNLKSNTPIVPDNAAQCNSSVYSDPLPYSVLYQHKKLLKESSNVKTKCYVYGGSNIFGYVDQSTIFNQFVMTRRVSQLESFLPEYLQSYQWYLCYQMSRDGSSLATLYSKSQNPFRNEYFIKPSNVELPPNIQGFILLFRDTDGSIFGCLFRNSLVLNGHSFSSSSFGGSSSKGGGYANQSSMRTHYGSHEIFVFRYVDGILEYFPNSRTNEYYIRCSSDCASFGGGSVGVAISIDPDLGSGRCEPCETFACPRLSKSERFTTIECELFALSSST